MSPGEGKLILVSAKILRDFYGPSSKDRAHIQSENKKRHTIIDPTRHNR